MNTRVKELRTLMNMTQKEFGSNIGLHTASINDIEKGRNGVNDRTIILICNAYHVNEEWLRFRYW